MKNSVFFKFIAILLCAVSLLGIVGSGLGILALTEGNLYNRTVDDLIEENTRLAGAQIAHSHAARYASMQLGGVPEALAEERFPQYGGYLSNYGYEIVDSQGTALESRNPDGFSDGKVYSFPVSGQYIHLVNLMTREEKYPSRDNGTAEYTRPPSMDDPYLYVDVPEEGTAIGSIFVILFDGSVYEYSDSYLGTLHYTRGGELVCHLSGDYFDIPNNIVPVEVVLADPQDTLVYMASSKDGVGVMEYTANGSIVFTSHMYEEEEPIAEPAATEPVMESVPEITEETVAATVPETVPPTVPETTVPEIDFTLEDNIPGELSVEVARIKATFADTSIFDHHDEGGFGRVRHVDGDSVAFVSYDKQDDEFARRDVTRIRFWDKKGDLILEAESPEGVGELYLDEEGFLAFRSTFPEIPVEETVPETTAETVPEETVPPTEETVPEETEAVTEPTVPEETYPAPKERIYINNKPLDEYEINHTVYYDYQTGEEMYAEYVYIPIPEYTVTLYVNDASLAYRQDYMVLRMVCQYQEYLLPALGISILVFLVFAVYLCCAAGRKPKSEEVRAGGLNRIPLDLYLCLAGFGIVGLFALALEGGRYLMQQNMLLGCSCAAGFSLAACALAVGLMYALVAQIKTPGGYWWRNTLCGHIFRGSLNGMQWLEKFLSRKFFPFCGRMIKWLWKFTCTAVVWVYRSTESLLMAIGRIIGRIFRWIRHRLNRFLSLLPMTWQWLLGGIFILLISVLFIAYPRNSVVNTVGVLLILGIVFYAAHCFGILAESARRMSKGDLDIKVEDKLMLGCFKDFAGNLNDLADVAVVAAQKQLKSERMKTELITNVSHDIKTPLTSIINYVDLLQKPHTQEEELQYLEVLDRQSLRLKKLIEDLMEMSKANTGNMTVEITRVDAVEAVNQAIGEFSDKLERARLIPVFRHTEPSVPMRADGRLVWRVMSNLLSNAVKYAMPGTRLYIDLAQVDQQVVISLKNISREELNMSAEELMERFVRGDGSRNTEGSGLGLNIARSLMELQKGSLQLLVDGDLFKVTLIFPATE